MQIFFGCDANCSGLRKVDEFADTVFLRQSRTLVHRLSENQFVGITRLVEAEMPDLPETPLPNFLVIGAQKCGTTALCAVLGRHPDVFMTEPKEPLFRAGRSLR